MLIDLLNWAKKESQLIKSFFELMGWHEGVHTLCPGWCPCDDYDDLWDATGAQDGIGRTVSMCPAGS